MFGWYRVLLWAVFWQRCIFVRQALLNFMNQVSCQFPETRTVFFSPWQAFVMSLTALPSITRCFELDVGNNQKPGKATLKYYIREMA